MKARCCSLYPWLCLESDTALSALSGLCQRLAVARCTLSCASIEAMLFQLFRASFIDSLSLAVPLAMPRLKRCSLSCLSFVQRIALARYTLDYASGETKLSQLFRTYSEARCRSMHPWLCLGSSDALSALSSFVQRLAVARCTLGYASVEAMFSQLFRAWFAGSLSLAVLLTMPRFK